MILEKVFIHLAHMQIEMERANELPDIYMY